MTSQDDDLMPETTSGYKLSQPKQSLAEYEKMGKSFLREAKLTLLAPLLSTGDRGEALKNRHAHHLCSRRFTRVVPLDMFAQTSSIHSSLLSP